MPNIFVGDSLPDIIGDVRSGLSPMMSGRLSLSGICVALISLF